MDQLDTIKASKVSFARALPALLVRDIGCALRNPTVAVCLIVALGFPVLLRALMPETSASEPSLRFFLVAFAAIMPVLEIGGVMTLFVMSEEASHGTYAMMVRDGISVSAIVASKIIAGALACTVLTPLCVWIAGIDDSSLWHVALFAGSGSISILMLFCGCGLMATDQMRVNSWAWPIVLAGMLPLLGAVSPSWSIAGLLSPLGYLVGTCASTATGAYETALSSQLVLVADLVVWFLIASSVLFRSIRAWRSAYSAHDPV